MDINVFSTQLHTVIVLIVVVINASNDKSKEHKVRNVWVNQLCPLSCFWHMIKAGREGGMTGWTGDARFG